jgi:predicted PurR-regulated permease PerM
MSVADEIQSQRQLILWTICMVAFAAIVLWSAYLARNVLLLIYVSGLFATGFSPLVRIIEKQKLLPVGTRRFPRWSAILLIYVMILGALGSVALMVAPPLSEQARALADELPSMFDRAQQYLVSKGVLDHPLTLREAVEQAPGDGTDAVGAVYQTVAGLVGGIFGFVTILILTFYILIDAETLFEGFLRLFPKRRRPQISEISRHITYKVSAWLTGQLLLAAVIGTTAAAGLWLIGVPYFYVLALIAAIGEMVPVVGPIFSAIPALAVALTVSPQTALFVLIFFIVQQQFENHVLVPKVMERQVGVSAVTIIVALLIGGSLLGIAGAVLAVPTAAILQVVVQEVWREPPAIVATDGPH